MKNHDRRRRKPPPKSDFDRTLDELGISKSEAHRWVLMSQVPEEVFEQYLAQCRAARKEPTGRGLLHFAGIRSA